MSPPATTPSAALWARPNCVEGFVGYHAGPGYDLATGLGSIDAYNLVTQWTLGTASTTTVTADPAKAGLTDTRDPHRHRHAAAPRGPAPTGTVSFLAENVVEAAIGTAALTPAAAGSTADARGARVFGDRRQWRGHRGLQRRQVVQRLLGYRHGRRESSRRRLPGGPLHHPHPGVQAVAHRQLALHGDALRKGRRADHAHGIHRQRRQQPGSLRHRHRSSFPPKGTLAAALAGNNLTVPIDRVFHFEGKDLDGTAWSRDVTVPFLDALYPGASTGMALRSAPATVLQNPKADPACQFSHRLILQETGGFLMQITTLRQGTTDLSASHSATLRHRPPGPLWNAAGRYLPEQHHRAGSQDLHRQRNQRTRQYRDRHAQRDPGGSVRRARGHDRRPPRPSRSPSPMPSAARPPMSLSTFTGGSPQWTASVVPGASWLTVSPLPEPGPARSRSR